VADRAGLVIIGAFEIGTAEHTSLASDGWKPADGIPTNRAVQTVKARLARQLRASRHPVMVMWFVGNEVNGAWQGFVCEDDYAEQHLSFTNQCQFGTAARVLMLIIDSLCETVHEEGLLCSTPLAGVNLPGAFTDNGFEYSVQGWIQAMDPIMVHLDVWSANLYPGRDFREFDFSRLREWTSRPFFVSEYGVDAYDTNAPRCGDDVHAAMPAGSACNAHSDARHIGAPNERMQAEWLMSLVEDVERNAVTCRSGCESQTVAGSSVMAWVDEWWKGRVIDAVDADERNGKLGSLCPDGNEKLQTPCGYPTVYAPTQPDSFVNEEWFGLMKVKRSCADFVDQIEPREAWYRMKQLWTTGGCVLHDPNFNVSYAPYYDLAQYPDCGAAITQASASECL
jgi:hypothetical protein